MSAPLMKKEYVSLPSFYVAGLTCRTDNQSELKGSNPKIASSFLRYFQEGWADRIPNRRHPGVTYGVYTHYDHDEHGAYTHGVGEAVSACQKGDDRSLKYLLIPEQVYAKLTVGPGAMPEVCQTAWQEIWKMSEKDLGGRRRYMADFEVYDERAHDPEATVLDIYIGIDPLSSGV